VTGAAIGGGVAASMTAINGGSWRDIGRSALHGAATGAISGAVTAGLLHGIDTYASTLEGVSKFAVDTAHTLAHGVVGGAMSAAEGGSFKDGFIGAAVSAALTPMITSQFSCLGTAGALDSSWQQIAARTAIAAVVGGTASVATGGKFASGALTAAFLHLLNGENLGRKLFGQTGVFKRVLLIPKSFSPQIYKDKLGQLGIPMQSLIDAAVANNVELITNATTGDIQTAWMSVDYTDVMMITDGSKTGTLSFWKAYSHTAPLPPQDQMLKSVLAPSAHGGNVKSLAIGSCHAKITVDPYITAYKDTGVNLVRAIDKFNLDGTAEIVDVYTGMASYIKQLPKIK
jgi:hypothetical protein